MKLNYRDRIVLTVLIVLLVWVGGIMLFIKPGIENLQDAQTALDDAKSTRSDLRERVKADEDLPQRIQAAYKEVNKMTESFYDAQKTQDAEKMVHQLLTEDEVTNLDVTYSDYTPYVLNPYAYKSNRVEVPIDSEIANYLSDNPVSAEDILTTPTNTDTSGTTAVYDKDGNLMAAPATIGCYKINFAFKGEIDNMESFCEKLQTVNKQKTMVVESIDYSFSQIKEGKGTKDDPGVGKVDENGKPVLSDTEIEGNMELTMMVVQKLPDPDTLGK